MGDQHLEIIASKLASRYKVAITLEKPKVAFRETIRKKSDIDSKYKKQSGGHGQFGDVWIEFEPQDEQEDMIDRYLERGSMYVLEDDGVKAECVVTDEGGGVLELKNIAVEPDFQGKGYGKALVDFLIRTYAGQYMLLQVGTGDSTSTIPFYESCGFRRHHLVKNFFTDHYDHPIYENGVQLVDMVYLQREI